MERHCSRFSRYWQSKYQSREFKLVNVIKAARKMSWAKESAKVGLGGIKPVDAARGAMFLPVFQGMPDPLGEEVEIESADQIPLVSVSI